MTDHEKHASDFLEWAGSHMDDVKEQVKTNWDEECFNNTVIRVYDAIIRSRNGSLIKDFSYYFKRSYYCEMLQMADREKKRENLTVELGDFDREDVETYREKEDRYQDADHLLWTVIQYVFYNYEPLENEVWRMKRLNKMTLKAICASTGLPYSRVQRIIEIIDKDIKANFYEYYKNKK